MFSFVKIGFIKESINYIAWYAKKNANKEKNFVLFATFVSFIVFHF